MNPPPVDPAEQLRAIARMCNALADQLAGGASSNSEASDPDIAFARRALRLRRDRDRLFGTELFADPAWDALLELFVADATGERISIDDICARVGVSPATARRWIGALKDRGLVVQDGPASSGPAIRLEAGAAVQLRRLLRP